MVMYLAHFDFLIKQLLPPSWRKDHWRYQVLRTLLIPLKYHIDAVPAKAAKTQQQTYHNTQILALEQQLSLLAQTYTRIEPHSTKPLTSRVLLPPDTDQREQKKSQLIDYLNTHKLAGTSFQIVDSFTLQHHE